MTLTTWALLGLAGLWSVGLIVAAALIRIDEITTTTNAGLTSHHSATLIGKNGTGAVALVCLPLATVGLLGALLRHRAHRQRRGAGALAWTVTTLVLVTSVLGMLTIGLFIAPVGSLLAMACAGTNRAD